MRATLAVLILPAARPASLAYPRRRADKVGALRAGVDVWNRNLPVLQWRRGWEARYLQDLLLVEGLPLQEGPGERIELLAVFAQESPGLVVALAYDPEHLGVHDAGGLLAEGILCAVTARSEERRVGKECRSRW